MTPRSTFERFRGMLFVLPALVALGLFLVYPAYYTIRLAFYEGSFNFGFAHYLGLKNFKDLLTHDPDFLDTSKFHGFNIVKELVYKNDGGALLNNLHWVIFYISFALAMGLGLAVLAVRVRYERAVKTAIFVPMAISATAVGVIWLLVYNTDSNIGVMNALWHGALHQHPVSWLGNPAIVNYALIFAYIWASVGFVMVVDSDFAAVTGADGSFRFEGVPVGPVRLRLWHEEAAETAEVALSVRPRLETSASPRLDVSGYKPQPHKNKYGKDYAPPGPDDERY